MSRHTVSASTASASTAQALSVALVRDDMLGLLMASGF
jgi:hypothetical protein